MFRILAFCLSNVMRRWKFSGLIFAQYKSIKLLLWIIINYGSFLNYRYHFFHLPLDTKVWQIVRHGTFNFQQTPWRIFCCTINPSIWAAAWVWEGRIYHKAHWKNISTKLLDILLRCFFPMLYAYYIAAVCTTLLFRTLAKSVAWSFLLEQICLKFEAVRRCFRSRCQSLEADCSLVCSSYSKACSMMTVRES